MRLRLQVSITCAGDLIGNFKICDPPSKKVSEQEQACQAVLQCYELKNATQVAAQVLQDWAACQVGTTSLSVCFGSCTHEFDFSITDPTTTRPWLSKLLTRVLRSQQPSLVFTSLVADLNGDSACWSDAIAEGDVSLLPLQLPEGQSKLWVELQQGDHVKGNVAVHHTGTGPPAGQIFRCV